MTSILRSIRVRLTLWYSSLLALTLVAFALLTYTVVGQILREERVILERETVQLDIVDQSGHVVRIEIPRRTMENRLLTIGCPEGVIRPDPRCQPLPPQLHEMVRSGVSIRIGQQLRLRSTEPVQHEAPRDPGRDDPEERAFLDALARGDSAVPQLERTNSVRLGFDDGTQDALLARLLRFLILAIPVIVMLSIVGGYLLARQALAPIGRITEAARRIRLGRLHERIHLEGPNDELKTLADTLDTMLAELEQLFEREKRFATDASHELQTPLAVIRTNAEVALGDPDLTPELRRAFETVVEGVERISRIVDDLLLLASYEQLDVPKRRTELRGVVAGVVAHLAPLAEERGIRLVLEEGADVSVRTVPDRVERAVMNLVDNALKYTERGSVRVSLQRAKDKVEIAIMDTGPGIDAIHLPHLFERFYRVDKARTRAAGGNGLGLAIVHAAVISLGGTIRVASSLGEGSTFVISLPIEGR